MEKATEANYIACDRCGQAVPQSCIIFEKGGSFPDLVNAEHIKHGVEICSACFRKLKASKGAVAA